MHVTWTLVRLIFFMSACDRLNSAVFQICSFIVLNRITALWIDICDVILGERFIYKYRFILFSSILFTCYFISEISYTITIRAKILVEVTAISIFTSHFRLYVKITYTHPRQIDKFNTFVAP